MNVSRETSDSEAVFEMWLLTRDPVKAAEESFYHEAHRVAMQAHEQRKSALGGDIRPLINHQKSPYKQLWQRFPSKQPGNRNQRTAAGR